MAAKWNFKSIGKALRPEAILDIFKGGKTAKNMKRRLVNSMVAGGTGWIRGGVLGGAGGGIWGYNEGKEALTGRNLGQNALRGVLAGEASRGIKNWTSNLGSNTETTSNPSFMDKLKSIPKGGGQQQPTQEPMETPYQRQVRMQKEANERKLAKLLQDINRSGGQNVYI